MVSNTNSSESIPNTAPVHPGFSSVSSTDAQKAVSFELQHRDLGELSHKYPQYHSVFSDNAALRP